MNETTLVPADRQADRGAAQTGPGDAGRPGRSPLLRDELHRSYDGAILEDPAAGGGPRRIGRDGAHLRDLLDLAPQVPVLPDGPRAWPWFELEPITHRWSAG